MPKTYNPLDVLPYEPSIKKNRTEVISLIVGVLLFIIGLSGLPISKLMGLHMSIVHCAVITTAGIILFWNGYLARDKPAFLACLYFGIFFGLHAILGFALDQFGTKNIIYENVYQRDVQVLPNFYSLSTPDHILNAILCVVLLAGAYDWSTHHKRVSKQRQRY